MQNFLAVKGNEIHVAVKALPGASKTELAGVREGRLWVRIAAAPEDGKANAALIAFVAKLAGCAKRDIVLLRGGKSRLKTLVLPLAYRLQLEKLQGEPCSTEGEKT
ncbi:MAG: DUF167 domain-containing protein [Treponema sp.]|nr:DUF167 domain-containing protein [Treponema sp.]